MSFKSKIKLIVLLTVCVIACTVAGCKVGGINKDDFLNKYDVAGQYVTYYANGGRFNGKARQKMDVYYRAGSPIISSNQQNFSVDRKFFNFDGWYEISVDSEGNPVTDEDGNYVFKDKIEPDTVVQAGQHLIVAARWIPVIGIDIYLITDDGEPLKDLKGNVYNSGDKLNTQNFGSSDTFGLIQSYAVTDAVDATYLYYFSDEACTKPVSSVKMPQTDKEEQPGGEDTEDGTEDTDSGNTANTEAVENIKVYVKYLRGNRTVVSDARGVSAMLKNLSGNGSYYLFSTDGSGVIDCANLTGADMAPMNNGICNINLQGNGVTIKNLSVAPRDISGNELVLGQTATYSLFGSISATSKITGVKFENLQLSVKAQSLRPVFLDLYLLNHGIEKGAEIKDVAFEKVDYKISTTGSISIDNVNRGNWLFCGEASDDEFVKKYGVTVSGASLYLNDTAVFENISK